MTGLRAPSAPSRLKLFVTLAAGGFVPIALTQCGFLESPLRHLSWAGSEITLTSHVEVTDSREEALWELLRSIAAEGLAVQRMSIPARVLPNTLPPVTLVYTHGPIPGGVARVTPANGEITLDGGALGRVGRSEQIAILQHEFAHIGLHAILDTASVPYWFEEGLAEWAGGDPCEGAERLWLEVTRRARSKEPLAPSIESSQSLPNRLVRDYLAHFMEFIESSSPGALSKGVLVERIVDSGFEHALETTTDATLDMLLDEWRESLDMLITGRASLGECH